MAAAAADAPDTMASVAQMLAGRRIKQAAALAAACGDVRLSILILQVCAGAITGGRIGQSAFHASACGAPCGGLGWAAHRWSPYQPVRLVSQGRDCTCGLLLAPPEPTWAA